MSKRIYISIPISGHPIEEQRAKAAQKEEYLKGLGFEVFNPFSVPEPPEDYDEKQKYAYYLSRDIEQLMLCDAIYCCKGAPYSKGCRIEYKVATELGLERYGEDFINKL